MKYFTKEWYKLSQQTSLHYGLHILATAETVDEQLFERLYKNKERKHIIFQRKLYNTDPRHMFPFGGYIPLEEIIDLSSIPDEHKITINPSEEEMKQLEEGIVSFENRPLFDEHLHKQEFSEACKFNLDLLSFKYPRDILSQVADYRVFALGYCTKQIYRQLKERSRSNSKMIRQISEAALNARLQQNINEAFYREIRFHDCKVVNVIKGEHLVLKLMEALHLTIKSRLLHQTYY